MTESELKPADLQQLGRREISEGEAKRQLALLRDPPARAALDRPCTVGDGIVALSLDERTRAVEEWGAASGAGRLTKFVPSSGAASRMFKELSSLRAMNPVPDLVELRSASESGSGAPTPAAATTMEFIGGLDRFAFRGALDDELRRQGDSLDAARSRGDVAAILEALLAKERLGYASMPKGLLPFHASGDDVRTAFDEHLYEAASYVADEKGAARIHYTVSDEHLGAFEARRDSVAPSIERRASVRLDVGFSRQSPATDTLAIDAEGNPFRDDEGRLVLRPGGHGALIRNLDKLDGDLVLIKNIDNVVPDAKRGPTVSWKRILAGMAARIQREIFDLQERLDRGEAGVVDEGLEFVARELSSRPGHSHEGTAEGRGLWLGSRLDRPLRICGVVKNQGEPGGGPFWVRDSDGGTTLQIVESASVDLDDSDQARIWGSSTHFNPVDIVAAVRHRHGKSYPLEEFVDWDGVFVADKSSHGRELRALERPGLWNGAMAHWNTVFVEVPLETFAPVKKIVDLLDPSHSA